MLRKLLWLVAIPLAAASLNEVYRETSQRIIDAAMADDGAYTKLSYLCDRIGHRLAGSEALNKAIAWTAAEMKKDGLENVVTPEVMVPYWVRGRESLTMVAPVEKPLTMLGLGGSIATPKEGIAGEVVVVHSFDELERIGQAGVSGKIVLYNVAYRGYGQTVGYRSVGASRAAKLGAVAALVRSVTPLSLQSAHTGMMDYAKDAPRIPAAAVTVEAALMIDRLAQSGEKVKVRLEMEARTLPDAKSANVIGDIRGRELPDQIVVMGGHIDSWDVGQGAQDDGTGCVSAMQAAAILKKLGLRPRRTIRVVLFTNEENGMAGGKAYREWAGDTVKNHVAAIEMDGGAEKVLGFGVGEKLLPAATEIGRLLEPLGAGLITKGGGGADIGPIMRDGVPGLALRTSGAHYFDWHHSEADTVDKVDPNDLKTASAALAVMAYVLADMP